MIFFSQLRRELLLGISSIFLPLHAMDLNQRLRWAASNGNIQEVQELINAGADSNARNAHNQTALMWSIIYGHSNVVSLLLNARAHVNTQTNKGETALIWAALYGHKDIVELLLKHGADITIKNKYGRTALDSAKHGAIVAHLPQVRQNCKEVETLLATNASAKKKLYALWVEAAKGYAARYPGIPTQEIIKYLLFK